MLNRWVLRVVFVQRRGIAYIRGERVPEGGWDKTKGPNPKGAEWGARNGESVKPGCGVEMEEVRHVLGGQAMDGLVSEEYFVGLFWRILKDFVVYAELDREPVEVN